MTNSAGYTLSADITRIGDFCAPNAIYATMDEAVNAACCLSSQHPNGATVYCTTEGVLFDSGEAYIVAVGITQRGTGATWDIPSAPYEPVYTITRALVVKESR